MAETNLDGAIGATDTDITLDDALSAEGDIIIQIGTELLLVERRGDTLNPQVRRGMFGTTAATHADNAGVDTVLPQVQTSAPASPPAASDGAAVAITPAEFVDSASVTFAADLTASLIAAGLMAEDA